MDKELKNYLEGMEDRLEKHIDKRFDDVSSEMAKTVQGLANHIDDRFDEIAPILAKVENHEKRIQYLENNALPKAA